MVTRISPKIDRISDQIVTLTDNANGAHGPKWGGRGQCKSNRVQGERHNLRGPQSAAADLTELHKTLDQARSLMADLQAACGRKTRT